jgi:hypothetical protein
MSTRYKPIDNHHAAHPKSIDQLQNSPNLNFGIEILTKCDRTFIECLM